MRDIKFRAWNTYNWDFSGSKSNRIDTKTLVYFDFRDIDGDFIVVGEGEYFDKKTIFMQYIGVQDKKGNDCYIGDICRFPNGDTFYFDWEEFLFVSVVWIGDPECEDQMRDLYRVYGAEIIGNIYENPELIK